MKTKIGALVATAAAAASATAAAVWAKRKRGGEARKRKSATSSGRRPAGAGGATATPSTADASSGDGNELTSIKGIGARSAERLVDVGVTTVAQVAAWTDTDIDEIAAQIHVGADRIRREDWVGQARAATKG
jgi:predicted flap endonuclease-1-like 5' DNA nuclease